MSMLVAAYVRVAHATAEPVARSSCCRAVSADSIPRRELRRRDDIAMLLAGNLFVVGARGVARDVAWAGRAAGPGGRPRAVEAWPTRFVHGHPVSGLAVADGTAGP